MNFLTDIFHSERVRLVLLALLVPVAHVAGVLPPLVVQNLYHALLLQLENRQRYFVPPGRACDAKVFVRLVRKTGDL